ncbi:Ornithine cyclodeaminase [Rhodovastum atsumiense]|uniref:Ornithine cyclodeaminase family protein n=1 Tax=Rhodovastum atsumiense TaxID=504468 RepID=A0A5M6IR08_9PROT|nr:ornithine cyclodeaminase family protein [Rhodovastum atsumiense]KAA5610339.1 ornithine cyclodeaminase family protein [Rhodovastum atsumiense]CAH2600919.1 Ornithine cyclodeaminase [Rhodovastum atsumiense]
MVRHISEAEVDRVLSMKDALHAVEQAFRDRATGTAFDAPRQRTRARPGTLHILQGTSVALGVVGFKAYYVLPQGHTALMVLLDAATGETRALIDAGRLGALRTGAATGVATRALATTDASVLGCIGAGRQMTTQIEAVFAVRPIRTVRVHARTTDRLRAFCRDMSARLDLDVEPVTSVPEAVAGADIVNVMTRSAATPVLDGAMLAPGMHINAAGVNRLDHRELDLEAVRRADVVAVDSRETARLESGDLLPAIEEGVLHWETLPELGDVLLGRHPGRSSEEQVTVFKSHGMALQDIYVAHHVLRQIDAG